MSESTYYQAGADGSGNPEGISQTISAETTSPNAVSQELNGNEPVTKEQLRSVMKELEDTILRKAQSHTDKLGSTLDKRIKSAQDEAAKAIGMLKASGVSLTPEQERTISQTAVNQALTARDDSPAVPERGKQESNDPSDFVNKEVHRIMSETGVYLTPEEAQTLIGQTRSPYEFIRKFEDICAERSTKPRSETRIPTLAPATGRAAQSVDVLKRQYDDEIAQINKGTHPKGVRRGNIQAITAIKEEYRKKGLDVY